MGLFKSPTGVARGVGYAAAVAGVVAVSAGAGAAASNAPFGSASRKARSPSRVFACASKTGHVIDVTTAKKPKCPASARLVTWNVASGTSPGGVIHSGHGAPTDAVGNVGDFWLDLDTYTLWGPKTAVGSNGTSTWAGVPQTSLIGPRGPQGPAGTPGGTGAQGPPGLSGYQVVQATPFNISPGQTESGSSPCPGGKLALGGGEDNSAGGDVTLLKSLPSSGGTGWQVTVHNSNSATVSHSVTVYAVCAAVAG